MDDTEIESIMAMVRVTALTRNPWLAGLREPTEDEFAKAQVFCERFPPTECEVDLIKTVVLNDCSN